jgi:hypothetical protein
VEHIPSFKDFYPKALLPTVYYHHPKWEKRLSDSGYDGLQISHWLVAYEWIEQGKVSGWHVLVYPADARGRLTSFEPVFMNERPIEFEEARELANRLEKSECTLYSECLDKQVFTYM